VPAALLLAAGITAWAARKPPVYAVTVVLRVTEGTVRSEGSELAPGTLRAHVDGLAFTSAHLIDVMRHHPKSFPHIDAAAADEVEDLRSRIEVEISQDDFIEGRSASDPPRSARIELTYRSGNPELAWSICHDLAELMIGSTLDSQRAALARARAVTAAALSQAESSTDEETTAGGAVAPPPIPAAGAFIGRLGKEAVAAEIGERAGAEQQLLRFEMVDPGIVPARVPRASRVRGVASTVLLSALVLGLLAGAFDPRVLDPGDLEAVGVASIGHFPGLDARASGVRRPAGDAGDGPSTSV
jgi:hypothetical protein